MTGRVGDRMTDEERRELVDRVVADICPRGPVPDWPDLDHFPGATDDEKLARALEYLMHAQIVAGKHRLTVSRPVRFAGTSVTNPPRGFAMCGDGR